MKFLQWLFSVKIKPDKKVKKVVKKIDKRTRK